ncbi:hypothetical protein BH23PLA1_BH23PLA1_35170 [soil metagenome]
MMAYDVTRQQLTALEVEWRTDRPHVVVLGAGASLAAFPSGDASDRRLPLMVNVVQVLGLSPLFEAAGLEPSGNFESLYSELHRLDPQSSLLAQIEQQVMEYFSGLELPRHPTLYDLLLLSLREKDAIFTFNWDPFLADAYARHDGLVPLPKIFHLHGNVRAGYCGQCKRSRPKAVLCQECQGPLVPSRLLYPVESKNYADDPFISTQWNAVRSYIKRAVIITIFGYSAPTTDQEAMAIFREAWKVDDPETRPVERVEIIDIRDHEELAGQWSTFAHFDHYNIRRSFLDSSLAHHPRRSCEAHLHMGVNGEFVEPIPWAGNLEGVEASLADVIAAEE